VFEDQSPTLKASQAAPSVAYGIQGNVIGRQPENGPAGKGHTEEGDPMFTLTKTDIHAIATPMAVRRLTPLECERLMGWPDDHTRFKADGSEQADTHRYKQCGNGVASPVAEWIGKQLMKLDEVA
jgi:DNA (cytosine-5)-methyltransferase 1